MWLLCIAVHGRDAFVHYSGLFEIFFQVNNLGHRYILKKGIILIYTDKKHYPPATHHDIHV